MRLTHGTHVKLIGPSYGYPIGHIGTIAAPHRGCEHLTGYDVRLKPEADGYDHGGPLYFFADEIERV